MIYYLNLRQAAVGGFVATDPCMMFGDATAITAALPNALAPMAAADVSATVAGRNILFLVHGFHVPQQAGAISFARMIPALDLAAEELAIGVLWPGDSWLPYIDYPFEGSVAISAGNALSKFCQTSLTGARSFSFASHSLGARVVLQALLGLPVQAASVTMAAAAVNQNCLLGEYAAAAGKATSLSLLASRGDDVLKLAFTAADPIADILHPDHSPFQPALGFAGPSTAEAPMIAGPWQIAFVDGAATNYGHSDYLPYSNPAPAQPPPRQPQPWIAVAGYFSNALYGRPQPWPPAPQPPQPAPPAVWAYPA